MRFASTMFLSLMFAITCNSSILLAQQNYFYFTFGGYAVVADGEGDLDDDGLPNCIDPSPMDGYDSTEDMDEDGCPDWMDNPNIFIHVLLSPFPPLPPASYDLDGDGEFAPMDILLGVNGLNDGPGEHDYYDVDGDGDFDTDDLLLLILWFNEHGTGPVYPG